MLGKGNLMNFTQATIMRNAFETHMKEAAQALKAIEGVGAGPMGLTPDHVKASPQYKEAKARFDWDFSNFRNFNAYYVKTFKKELAALRRSKCA